MTHATGRRERQAFGEGVESPAADLHSDSAGLVHENERRWPVFRSKVLPLLGPDATGT